MTGACVHQRAGLYWVPNIRHEVQRVWMPNVVAQQVSETTMVPRLAARQVPVEVCSYQEQQVCRRVPYTVTRMVAEEQVRRIPYTVSRPVVERVERKVPVQVCRMVTEEVVRQIPVTTCRMVYEERVEQTPVQVCRMVAVQETVRVPRCVEKRVPITYTCTVPRTICCRIPVDPCGVTTETCVAPSTEIRSAAPLERRLRRRPSRRRLREPTYVLPCARTEPDRSTPRQPAARKTRRWRR